MFENKDRPAWLNWLFLGIFLLSSWQLAGFWFEKLQGSGAGFCLTRRCPVAEMECARGGPRGFCAAMFG